MPVRTLLPRLIEALYGTPQWRSQAALAVELGTTASSLAPWIQSLTFFRALTPDEHGFRIDKDRLLRVLTAWRMADLRPSRPFYSKYSVDEIGERLLGKNIQYTFGFFTAANRYAFYEPRQDVQIYIAPGSVTAVRNVLAGEKQTDHRMMRVQLFEEPLRQIGSHRRDGVIVTTPLQTVIDLRAHPEGGAHAGFLAEKLLTRMYPDAK